MVKIPVDLSVSWTATMALLNSPAVYQNYNPPCNAISVSSFGQVTLGSDNGNYIRGPAQEHGTDPVNPDDPETEWLFWNGQYYQYTLTIIQGDGNGGTQINERDCLIYFGDFVYFGRPDALTPGDYILYDKNPEIDVTCSFTGISLRGVINNINTEDRGLMDFTDLDVSYTWALDEGATGSITCEGVTLTCIIEDPEDFLVQMNTGNLSIAFAVQADPTVMETGISYGGITAISWSGAELPLGAIDLYSNGMSYAVPDTDHGNETWSRVSDNSPFHVIGSPISIQKTGVGTPTGSPFWTGLVSMPYIVEFNPISGEFSDSDGVTIDYESPYVEWVLNEGGNQWSVNDWTAVPIVYSGNTGAITQINNNWQFPWERQKFNSLNMYANVTAQWRELNREVVGVGDLIGNPNQNDRKCGIYVHPINGDLTSTSPWFPMLGFTHFDTLDLLDPAKNFSTFTGTNVDVVNNTTWTVTAANPVVQRNFLTRYWLRMDRCSTPWVDGQEVMPDWPIILKANTATGEDPDWLVTIPNEDPFSWQEWKYMRVDIDAPKEAKITVEINYSNVSVTDPCYTCAEHRWDEFEYTRTQHVLNYDINVASGFASYFVDFALPKEKVVPVGQYRMQIIDNVKIHLPDGVDDVWTLSHWYLVLDPGLDPVRNEPTYHIEARYKRAWNWRATNWFGFGAVVDGVDAMELDYGYGHNQNEKKLLYIQRSQHCPDSEATGEIDSAKPLSRLVNEINYLEGWDAQYFTPETMPENMDADLNQLGTFYWWCLRNNHIIQAHNTINMDGALVVGRHTVVAGIKNVINHFKFPDGKLHGLAFNKNKTRRVRSKMGVYIWSKYLNEDWQFVEKAISDEHGRYVSTPLKEKDYTYSVDGTSYSLTVVNDSYTTKNGTIVLPPKKGLNSDKMKNGSPIYRVHFNFDDELIVERMDILNSAFTSLGGYISNDPDYTSPSIAYIDDLGWYVISVWASLSEETFLWVVKGDDIPVLLTSNHIAKGLQGVDIDDWHGQIWVSGWTSDEKLHVRVTSKEDFTAESPAIDIIATGVPAITEGEDGRAPLTSIQVRDDTREIIVMVETDDGVDTYSCKDIDSGLTKL